MPNHSRRLFAFALARILPVAALLPGETLAQAMATAMGHDHPEDDSLDSYRDGRRDSTAAIQAVIDESTATGNPAFISPGTYLIDPDVGIYLRSDTRLMLDQGAQLVARGSASGRYGIVRIHDVDNVLLSGGMIVGDRNHHLGKAGEWGMGIDVGGSSDVTIADVTTKDCWGDGIYVGTGHGIPSPCRNVVLRNVTATNNRRQGLSIVACIGAHVIGSKFLATNGTPPACGIDLEPNGNAPVADIDIENCHIEGNAGSGIQTWNHASNIRVTGCTITGNRTYGILLGGRVRDVVVQDNRIMGNGSYDLFVGKDATRFSLAGNTLSVPHGSILPWPRKNLFIQK